MESDERSRAVGIEDNVLDCDVVMADDLVREVIPGAVWCQDFDFGMMCLRPSTMREADIPDDRRSSYMRVDGILYAIIWTNRRDKLESMAGASVGQRMIQGSFF